MNIFIGAVPRFDIEITPELVALIMRLGGMHYDGYCRKATQLGGFVYGWHNRVTLAPDAIETAIATFSQLDMVAKIVEFPPPLTPEETAIRKDLVKSIHAAIQQYRVDSRFGTSIPVIIT
jgi:hypothetical protein